MNTQSELKTGRRNNDQNKELEKLIRVVTLGTRNLLYKEGEWSNDDIRQIAHDLTTDAYLELDRVQKTGELTEDPKSFLFRYVKNRVRRKEFQISKQQQHDRNTGKSLEEILPYSIHSEPYLNIDCMAILKRMTPEQQAIIILVSEDYTHKEIAAILDITVERVAYQLGIIRIESNRRYYGR